MKVRIAEGKGSPRTRQSRTPVSNLSLSERLAAHDQTAILELHARLAPTLLGIAAQMARDRRDAAWAVEEAFVRLWLGIERPPGDKFSPILWLMLETRRLALHRRRHAHTKAASSPAIGQGPQVLNAWMPGPSEISQLDARRELLKKVFHQLPKHQQEALKLAVWEGLGEPEIAARLGEPLARVEATLRAGMRFIRHRINVVMGRWSAPI
jgi:RNA polymerase sigma-70 factor, ECF subfamily